MFVERARADMFLIEPPVIATALAFCVAIVPSPVTALAGTFRR